MELKKKLSRKTVQHSSPIRSRTTRVRHSSSSVENHQSINRSIHSNDRPTQLIIQLNSQVTQTPCKWQQSLRKVGFWETTKPTKLCSDTRLKYVELQCITHFDFFRNSAQWCYFPDRILKSPFRCTVFAVKPSRLRRFWRFPSLGHLLSGLRRNEFWKIKVLILFRCVE